MPFIPGSCHNAPPAPTTERDMREQMSGIFFRSWLSWCRAPLGSLGFLHIPCVVAGCLFTSWSIAGNPDHAVLMAGQVLSFELRGVRHDWTYGCAYGHAVV